MKQNLSILENRLLSLIRSGETLRFNWIRGESGRFGMSVEGLGLDEASGYELGQRIAAFFQLMEKEGLDFCNSGSESPQLADSEGEGAWLELLPRENRFPVDGEGGIGFGSDTESSNLLRLPALETLRAPDLSGYFLDLVERSPHVKRISICLTRCELDKERERVLARNLSLPFSDLLRLSMEHDVPGDLQRFMALWLVYQRGWRLRLLVRVTDEKACEVPLGFLGREWFDTDCRIVPARMDGDAELDPRDFSVTYPEGWSFPALFPPAYVSERLQVEAGLNLRLPVLPETGLCIGKVSGREVRMPLECRDQHTYILGATGTGKSTLLRRMIRHDLEQGESVVLLDPHGDLHREVLAAMPAHRGKDVLSLDPGGMDPPPGFNILSNTGDENTRALRADFIIGELLYLFMDQWGNNRDAFGPMFELYFRNAILLLMHQPDVYSLAEFDRVMIDKEFRKGLVESCSSEQVVRFWKQNAEKVSGDASLSNVAPYITSKVSPLLQSHYVGKMLSNPVDELRLGERLQQGGILLANLNKGVLGHAGSRLLGSLICAELFSSGLQRSRMAVADRKPVNVYIDEFQNFVSPTVASMFSEARKFGLRLHVANQTLGQLSRTGDDIQHSVLGNVGNQIFFRVGVQDTASLEPFFSPFTRGRMQELPNYRAFIRLMTPEGPLRPFIMETLPEE